ncbi:MAG: bacterial transcriptional activator domain-containing protein [Anaerolineae bacterium]|nr:bacterial transcriptional activator domain-containing protein [Anaerolineae bacterium]
MTTRNDIFDTFWPTLKKHEATNVFHVTKRKISEILGQDLTTYGSGFYRIADNIQVFYDVVAFQEAVQNAAIADEDEAILMYQDAIRLYRGPFLSTIDQEWAVKRREELQGVYVEALCGLADIHRHRDQLVEALGFYQRASAITPQREDIAREIMQIHLDLDQPQHARETYERLRQELKNSLHVDPSPETQKLARQIP